MAEQLEHDKWYHVEFWIRVEPHDELPQSNDALEFLKWLRSGEYLADDLWVGRVKPQMLAPITAGEEIKWRWVEVLREDGVL